jgi:hypothetical protein
MTPQVILIVAGYGLVVVGLVGGGITSKYFTVGSVNGIARILCVIVGAGFIIGGVVMVFATSNLGRGSPSGRHTSSKANGSSIPFEIQDSQDDRLNRTNVSDGASVYIDGKYLGTMNINNENPRQTIFAQVPDEGTHDYRIVGMRKANDSNDQVVSGRPTGVGKVNVKTGSRFALRFSDNFDRVTLEPVD